LSSYIHLWQLLAQANPFIDDTSSGLSQFKIELENLRKLLGGAKIKGQTRRHLVQSLHWPFKCKEVEKIVGIIERHELTLSVVLDIALLDV
jgi:hypothetical protein